MLVGRGREHFEEAIEIFLVEGHERGCEHFVFIITCHFFESFGASQLHGQVYKPRVYFLLSQEQNKLRAGIE